MKNVYNNSAAVLLLIGMSLLCGCPPTDQSPRIVGTAPAYMVTVQEAAMRLGMTVTKADYPYVEMSGGNNRVLLFLYDQGKVYVNGTSIGQVGTVQLIGGTYYVSEHLIPKIRGSITGATAARPMPGMTPPTRPGPGKGGTIAIDPGPGGRDPGAIGILGTHEKVLNLQIAHRLADILRQEGYHVIMTRETDVYVEKEERAAIANRAGADLFVSIHCDSHNDRSHKGFTIYIAREASWTSKKVGRQLENVMSSSGIPSKGLRNADYVVLVQTRCPAVLVECGFMSNPEDANNLINGWYQGKIARAIADGIIQSL